MRTTCLALRFSALGVVMALAVSVLSACGSGGDSSSQSDPNSQNTDFTLSLGAADVTTLRGAPGWLLVKIERKSGFADDVIVDLVDPPAGVTSTGVVLTVGAQALLGITVDDSVALGELNLTVAASAGGNTSRASLKVTVQPGQPATGELIASALAAGRIDLGTSLLYRAYAQFGDSRLPREYVGSGQSDHDNDLFREIARNAPLLSAALNDQLLAFTVRPTDPRSVFSARPTASPSTLVNGRKSATAAVLVTSKDQCTTGTEEWISRLSRAVEPGLRVWVLCHGDEPRNTAAQSDLKHVVELLDRVLPEMAKTMKPMLSDRNSPDNYDDAVDLYILPTGVNTIPAWENLAGTPEGFQNLQRVGGVRGQTPPVDVGKDPAYSATIFIPEREVRTENFQINLIHELFHATQYAYTGNLGGFWFSDASAVWASTYFPRALKGLGLAPKYIKAELSNRFVQGQSADAAGKQYGFLLQTLGLLDISNPSAPYSSFVWPLFMEQMGGVDGAKSIATAWLNLSAVAGDGIAPKEPSAPATSINQASDAVNNALAFEPNFRKFALRNLNREFLPGDPLPKSARYEGLEKQFPSSTPLPKNFSRTIVGKNTDQGYSLAVPLAPLSAGYYMFDVAQSDPELRQVLFDLEGARLTGLDVDALVKINGTWESAPRDLNGKGQLRFCLDKPAEKLEEIWFIFSNHEHYVGREIDPQFRAKGLQAPCKSQLRGSSSGTLNGGLLGRYEYDASNVVWEQDPTLSSANVAVYRPIGGSVSFRQVVPGCTVTAVPSTYLIKADDFDGMTGTTGSLSINYNNDPPTYGGAAATSWYADVTLDCPGSAPSTGRVRVGTGGWFGSPVPDRQTRDLGTRIEDSFTAGDTSFNYLFLMAP